MTMTNIAEFLAARFDEDEATGKHLLEWTQHPLPGRPPDTFAACITDPIIGPFNGRTPHTNIQTGRNIVHIANPARVLAEVTAKRRILAEVVPAVESEEAAVRSEFDIGVDGIDWHEASTLLLRLLAAPYASHPDYDESWRP